MDSTATSAVIDTSSIWTHWLLTGFITSVFTSVFFYLFLWTLKPDIQISPGIAEYTLPTRDGPVTVYGFKVINKAWIHKAVDVQCELLLLEDVNTDGGTNVFLQTLKLRYDKTWYVNRRFMSEKGTFACVFHTQEDLPSIWNSDNKRLQFQLICKHSLSGFSKVFAMTYYTKGPCIKRGKFKFGNSFKIV